MAILATMPRYEAYKNSGEDWIADIPEHWGVKKLKHIAKIINGDSLAPALKDKFSSEVDAYWPYIASKDINVNTSLINYENGIRIPHSYKNYKLAPNDSSLICIEGGSAGKKIAFTNQDICYVNKLACLRSKHVSNRFIYYSLYAEAFQTQFKLSLSGLIGGVAISAIKNFCIVNPPLEEQNKIVNFLDNKTSQIDEAIAIKEKQISMLKERNQIIIQKAVTKGITPNMPMKDSGEKWIGQIPEHWDVIKLKRLFKEKNDRTDSGSETLFSLRMELGLVPHDDVSDKPISDKELIGYKRVDAGQMVMNRMRAAIGVFGIARSFGLVSPDYAVFSISNEIVSEYYLSLFKQPLICTQFRLGSKGMGTGSSGFMRLYTDNFGNIKVPNPPKEDQVKIMHFIVKTTEEISNSIVNLKNQVENLKEYKTTLINSAVTGKFKVA